MSDAKESSTKNHLGYEHHRIKGVWSCLNVKMLENAGAVAEQSGTSTAIVKVLVSEVTVEQLVQQYPHITFSTVLQDCKRTLERAYQMGWTPNMSAASS
ncbi:F-box/LRR-repeat protein 17 [Camelus dromedarius]|uniref:F-box/LRR-repeat protein 17 n=1 Tax=Camelus dromedarius TaxID=9838 RepID=A0A5N4EBK6_CAMDR|nr:F-box/LRR-repeat protein 17 [Camelus dromedarius]